MKVLVSLVLIAELFLAIFIAMILLPDNVSSIISAKTKSTNEKTATNKPYVNPSPDYRKETILFVSNATGNQEIYQMNLQTKDAINLTNNPAEDMNPQVSPDGKSILFYSNRSGQNKIYKMHLKDQKITQLTQNSGNDYDPSYSPDGEKIVFKSTRTDGKGDIFIMNEDGSEQTNLTENRKDTEEWDPMYSIDGKKILFVVRESTHLSDELYSIDIDGTNLTQLTQNTIPDWYPSINLITGKLLFISRETLQSKEDIFMFEDNNRISQITNMPGNEADPSWNTQGNKIVFINDQTGNYDLYTMNADGTEMTKLLETTADELSPIFLP